MTDVIWEGTTENDPDPDELQTELSCPSEKLNQNCKQRYIIIAEQVDLFHGYETEIYFVHNKPECLFKIFLAISD